MSNIAVFLPAMRMGGAEKAALSFLRGLMEYYDVTLVLNKMEGELLESVPDGIRILEDRLWDFRTIVRCDIKKLRLRMLFRDIVYYFNVKTGRKKEKNYRYLVSRTPALPERFDAAIGYVANVSTQIFSLADRTNADMKIAWIHGETTELYDTELFGGIYKSFDRIYAVSNVTREHFIKRFPSCADITSVYFNPCNREDILTKANEAADIIFDNNCINLCSVGRLSHEKGFMLVPETVRIVLDHGYKIRWYLIGDGPERKQIEDKIDELSLGETVRLLGTRANPYPFMKSCDIYIQPSYEEGYCLTICEAVILEKAIICTVPASNDLLDDGKTAIVVNPNVKELAEAIISLIESPEKKTGLIENIREVSPDGRDRIRDLLDVIDNKVEKQQ